MIKCLGMYCPVCLNQSLTVSSQGVVHVVINGKQRDNGRFLFSMLPKDQKKLVNDFKTKVDEFFQWYTGLANHGPIAKVELLTSDMKCKKGCRFPTQSRFSAVNVILSEGLIAQIVQEYGQKHGVMVKLS